MNAAAFTNVVGVVIGLGALVAGVLLGFHPGDPLLDERDHPYLVAGISVGVGGVAAAAVLVLLAAWANAWLEEHQG